jgi:hypothetical protein
MFFPLTQVTIKPRKPKNKNDSLVQMSNQLFTSLGLKKNFQLNIKLGKKTIQTTVQTVELDQKDLMLIPEHILINFCLPIQNYKFQAIYRPDFQTLELGPLIGLLTDFPSKKQEEPHFRSIHAFCEELHQGITDTGGFFFRFFI